MMPSIQKGDRVKQITLEKLKEQMHPETWQKIDDLAERADALVLFVNQDFWSSNLGQRTVLAVGAEFTYKSVSELEGRHLNDLPSQRLYPVAFVELREGQNESSGY